MKIWISKNRREKHYRTRSSRWIYNYTIDPFLKTVSVWVFNISHLVTTSATTCRLLLTGSLAATSTVQKRLLVQIITYFCKMLLHRLTVVYDGMAVKKIISDKTKLIWQYFHKENENEIIYTCCVRINIFKTTTWASNYCVTKTRNIFQYLIVLFNCVDFWMCSYV